MLQMQGILLVGQRLNVLPHPAIDSAFTEIYLHGNLQYNHFNVGRQSVLEQPPCNHYYVCFRSDSPLI